MNTVVHSAPEPDAANTWCKERALESRTVLGGITAPSVSVLTQGSLSIFDSSQVENALDREKTINDRDKETEQRLYLNEEGRIAQQLASDAVEPEVLAQIAKVLCPFHRSSATCTRNRAFPASNHINRCQGNPSFEAQRSAPSSPQSYQLLRHTGKVWGYSLRLRKSIHRQRCVSGSRY
jgi:hypothetical protein